MQVFGARVRFGGRSGCLRSSRQLCTTYTKAQIGALGLADLQESVIGAIESEQAHRSTATSWLNKRRKVLDEDDSSTSKRATWMDGEFFSSDPAVEQLQASRIDHDGIARQRWKALKARKVARETGSIMQTHERICSALRSGSRHKLFDILVSCTQDPEVVAAIPTSTFLEILRELQPEDTFLPLRHAYKMRTPSHYKLLHGQIAEMFEELQRYRQLYDALRQGRTLRGDCSLSEYKELLRCTRGTWDGAGALKLMNEMLEKNVRPDLDCYNLYFEARCWSDIWHPEERHRLRVFPHIQEQRKLEAQHHCRNGTVLDTHRVGQAGLKSEIVGMFTHMIENGTAADQCAYTHLITALGREGDIGGVKAILKRVWDVDVDALMDGSAEPSSPAIVKKSPLYPDSALLLVLAQAFGSNNDVPTAFRVVDFLAQKYSLFTTSETHLELMGWAYVLSTRRYKQRKIDGTQVGQLPMSTVEDLWNILTNDPYQCKPSLAMYDLMIRSFRRRHTLFPMLKHIIDGCETHLLAMQSGLDKLDACANADGHSDELEAVSAPEVSEPLCKKRFENRRLSFAVGHEWLRLMLSGPRFLYKNHRIALWQRQLLPDVVDIFWRYRDVQGLEYRMESGTVKLQDAV